MTYRESGRRIGRPDAPPFETSASDSLRLKLREIGRRIFNGNSTMPANLPTIPGVQSLSIATRYIDGGRTRFVEYVQFAMLNHREHSTRWWMVYADLLPAERHRVSYDDVCAAAGVAPAALMSEVVSVAMEFGNDVGNLVAAAVHPAIVHQAGKSAKRIGGQHAQIGLEDRKMMLQHQGFAPVPKGASIHVHASATAQAAAAASADPSVPGFADDMAALARPRQGVQRQLTEASHDLDPIDIRASRVASPVTVPSRDT